MLLEILWSVCLLLYYVILDLLNVSWRSLSPLLCFFVFNNNLFPTFFQGDRILAAILVTIPLIVVYVLLLKESIIRVIQALFALDAVLQLVSRASQVIFAVKTVYYPTSLSLVVLFALQIPWYEGSGTLIGTLRYSLAAATVVCVNHGARMHDFGFSAASSLFFVLSLPLFLFTITPSGVWSVLGELLTKLLQWIGGLLSIVYLFIKKIWPPIREFFLFVWALTDHRFSLLVKHYVIFPIVRIFGPLLLPTCSVLITRGLLVSLLQFRLDSVNSVCLFAFQAICVLSSTSLTILLLVHAAGRIANIQIDPLRVPLFNRLIRLAAKVFSVPVIWMGRIVLKMLDALIATWSYYFHLLNRNFFLTLFQTFVIVGVLFVCTLYMDFSGLGSALGSFFSSIFASIAQVSENSTDSTLAVCFICISQLSAFRIIGALVASASLDGAEEWADSVDASVLIAAAEGLRDPRQCARCAFGPVDYDGCNMLLTHHLEARVGGARVSNECPRCGWLTNNLEHWPYFEPLRHALRSSVARQRLWSDVVVCCRAASKAMIFPYGILVFVSPVSPALAALLALGYLVPWAIDNSLLFGSVLNGQFLPTYPRRNLAPGDAYNVGCGARPAPRLEVSQQEVLDSIATSNPDAVFVAPGDACSVCLEDLAAIDVMTRCLREKHQAAALRKEGLVALRCGHLLHEPCAVALANANQYRCPLCREPMTLQGAAAARVFN